VADCELVGAYVKPLVDAEGLETGSTVEDQAKITEGCNAHMDKLLR